ncbi:hypothetical protein I8752_01815 [Nostocaceae cyanobacterium CENA369]|uniref:Uncharacterized protein n=1 Tax=Dendronalium phyllosphericum CENA369 TaxID=1725256 RepID=A0A8J7HX53_9NOST|nr:hypothetical protein [Dendronalium phyllosphericum]MBH8571784.1 hypothetical protein [Dendronalium phyllosphericum CENA369]
MTDETTQLLYPSIEKLVEEIVAVNHAWKVACELFGQDSPLSISSRDLKTYLQVRLLRSYAPEQVYLIEDKESEGEPLYSLRLRESIGNRLYAEHLPMRIAQKILADKELEQFERHN